MEPKKTTFQYKFLKGLVRLCYPRIETLGVENLPDEPVIIVGNHCQMHGPIACELYFPVERYTWCAGQMMEWKEVPSYAFDDFWSQKPKYTHPWFRLLSYLITPFSVCLFSNANTIPVHRDTRIISTFKQTVRTLQEGVSVVVFPEHDAPHNHIVYDFQNRFIDVAKMYYKKTGKEISFVPLYIAPKLRKMVLGKPVPFHADAPMEEERQRISQTLMDEITGLAEALPVHTVVPYRNIPKKLYPVSK